MRDIFKVSKTVARGIQSGEIQPEELVLCQTRTTNTRVWEVKRATRANQHDPSIRLKGQELLDLFKSAANHQETGEFAQVGALQGFRVFSKQMPGMEAPEHRQAVQGRIHHIGGRIRAPLRILGKGIAPLKRSNKPWKMVDVDYLLVEGVHKTPSLSPYTVRRLVEMWKRSDTPLSYEDWMALQQKNWRTSGSQEDLITWVGVAAWEAREKKAWQLSTPPKGEFEDWKKTQYPPERLLPEPLWLLKQDWAEDCQRNKKEGIPRVSFEKWTQETIQGRKKFYERFIDVSEGVFSPRTIDDASFKVFDQYMFENSQSAPTALDDDVYIARREWESTHPTEHTEEGFLQFIEQRQYAYFLHSNAFPFPPSFEEWKEGKLERLTEAWTASKTGLPFERWKAQQYRDPVNLGPFVRLDARERQHYRAECLSGKLVRAGTPYSTAHEHTGHSGAGWVIFVLGPDHNLYCASHYPGTFHHSSFLGDGAVMAAGEIKTAADGTITHISSKSGHYKPSAQENVEMLRYFEAQGVVLSNVEFTYFTKEGESPPQTAQAYLDAQRAN